MPVGALHAMVVLAVPSRPRSLPLAAQRQDAALQLDLDLVLLESGKLGRQDDPLLVLMDVHRRNPRTEAHLLVAVAARRRRRSRSSDPG